MKKTAGLIRIIFIAAMALCLPAEAQQDKCFGHDIPAFREVFIKLFRATAGTMNMEQMKNTSIQLSDTERAALSYFLGKEGHEKVKEGLSDEKQEFLDQKYAVHTEIPPERDFESLFPHVLAVSNNNLEKDQLEYTLNALTPEDLASQSFFLGEEGRATLFSEMTMDRVEVVLDHIPDWVFIETGRRKYETIRGYTSICYKQERLDNEDLQDVETVLLKYRDDPWSIYMKWLDGPWKGRELVYNEKVLGAGRVRVRERGIWGVLPLTLPVDSELAQRGSNHMVTEIGLKNLLDMIMVDYMKAAPKGHIKRVNHGIEDLDGHKVYKMESILPKDKSLGYYCYRMVHYIDFIRSLEIKAEMFNWKDQLYESYYYTQIKINPGLTDRDFDPENPDYRLD